MIEVEKKDRLTATEREQVLQRLKEAGAEDRGEEFEENTIYGGGVLEGTNSIVRIRRTQDRSFLTFKRRLTNQSDVKEQIEFETEVADADAAANIVSELGLFPGLVYEKRRKTWLIRDVEVVVDELPFGLFMEIEGSVTGIKEVEILLGIEHLETEHDTYPRLTARHGKNIDGRIEARFD